MTGVASMIYCSHMGAENASIEAFGYAGPLDIGPRVLTSITVLPPMASEVRAALFYSLGDDDPAARFRYNMGPG